MTSNKDLKRLVRARMKKTGEAYTAARAVLLDKRSGTTEPAANYAAMAGMSDTALQAKTGCTWEQCVRTLDRARAATKTHAEIAELVRKKYKAGAWWSQMVAVGYERIKGLRARGQQRDGSFQASKSRTYGVPIGTLFDAWADAGTRKRWLNGGGVRVRTATKPKSMRIGWTDGTIVAVTFAAKGPRKSSVAVEQGKLPGREAAAQVKAEWGERFDALRDVLTDRA